MRGIESVKTPGNWPLGKFDEIPCRAAADLKRIEEELQKVIAVLEGEKVRLGL